MKRFTFGLRLSLALLMVAAPCMSASADCRRRCHIVTPVHHVVEEVIVSTFAQIVPLFQVGYAAAPYAVPAPIVQAPPPASPTAGSDVVAMLQQISARLDRLEKGAAAPSPGPVVAMAATAHPLGKCARCHESGVAANKGGGLALLKDGQPLDLSSDVLLAVAKATYTGTMPKAGDKLTDEEVAKIMAWLPMPPAKK